MVSPAHAVVGDAADRARVPASPSLDAARVPGWIVVPLRLYLSSVFLEALTNKVGPHLWSAWLTWMPDYVARQAPHAAAFYRPLLTALVLPHATAFAALVAIGEVALGVALLLGVVTRLAAACGVLLTANYFLFNGLGITDVSNDFAIMVGLIVVLAAGAGRTLGVDAWLAKRWPNVPLW